MSGYPDLVLYSQGLLSKWGFNDGDEPEWIWDYCDEHGIDWGSIKWHPVLQKLVREHLLPALAEHHEIELVDIGTIHNPIRAELVDGEEVDWIEESTIKLTPESVTVPLAVVLAAMAEVGTRP